MHLMQSKFKKTNQNNYKTKGCIPLCAGPRSAPLQCMCWINESAQIPFNMNIFPKLLQ